MTAISEQFDVSYYDAVRYQQWAELFTKAAKEVPHQLGKWEFLAGLLWRELGKTEEALKHLLRVVANVLKAVLGSSWLVPHGASIQIPTDVSLKTESLLWMVF